MKRTVVIIVVIVAIALGGWWAYNEFVARPEPTVEQTDQEEAAAQALENVIWASGKLLPRQWAGLSPSVGGAVAAIHVQEGDWVDAGELLLELDNAVLKSQVEVAKAALAEAEAARDKLLAGATPAEIEAARADVAAAEAAVALAQAQLQHAQEAVAAAESQVAIAQAQYDELAGRPTKAERLAAKKQVDLAKAAVDQAQAAFNVVRGNPHAAALPEALALQQATIAYEAAQAEYEVVLQGATRQQLAVARAQIDAAKRQVAVAKAQIPIAEANVKAAEAQLARAQAALQGLLDGPTAEDKALAETRVQQARAALASAQAQLAQTQVKAPFAGEVGKVLARVGELASPGVPTIMLGDTRHMRVETTDLRETDVTRLAEGMSVEVTFDSLPGEVFQGEITHIAAMSTVEKGSTNYTVIVELAELDPRLRWGMTAFVNITTE